MEKAGSSGLFGGRRGKGFALFLAFVLAVPPLSAQTPQWGMVIEQKDYPYDDRANNIVYTPEQRDLLLGTGYFVFVMGDKRAYDIIERRKVKDWRAHTCFDWWTENEWGFSISTISSDGVNFFDRPPSVDDESVRWISMQLIPEEGGCVFGGIWGRPCLSSVGIRVVRTNRGFPDENPDGNSPSLEKELDLTKVREEKDKYYLNVSYRLRDFSDDGSGYLGVQYLDDDWCPIARERRYRWLPLSNGHWQRLSGPVSDFLNNDGCLYANVPGIPSGTDYYQDRGGITVMGFHLIDISITGGPMEGHGKPGAKSDMDNVFYYKPREDILDLRIVRYKEGSLEICSGGIVSLTLPKKDEQEQEDEDEKKKKEEEEEEKEKELKLQFTPQDALPLYLEWSSSNEDVVSVNNGTLTLNKAGTATITVKARNGADLGIISSSCLVTVEEPETVVNVKKTKRRNDNTYAWAGTGYHWLVGSDVVLKELQDARARQALNSNRSVNLVKKDYRWNDPSRNLWIYNNDWVYDPEQSTEHLVEDSQQGRPTLLPGQYTDVRSYWTQSQYTVEADEETGLGYFGQPRDWLSLSVAPYWTPFYPDPDNPDGPLLPPQLTYSPSKADNGGWFGMESHFSPTPQQPYDMTDLIANWDNAYLFISIRSSLDGYLKIEFPWINSNNEEEIKRVILVTPLERLVSLDIDDPFSYYVQGLFVPNNAYYRSRTVTDPDSIFVFWKEGEPRHRKLFFERDLTQWKAENDVSYMNCIRYSWLSTCKPSRRWVVESTIPDYVRNEECIIIHPTDGELFPYDLLPDGEWKGHKFRLKDIFGDKPSADDGSLERFATIWTSGEHTLWRMSGTMSPLPPLASNRIGSRVYQRREEKDYIRDYKGEDSVLYYYDPTQEAERINNVGNPSYRDEFIAAAPHGFHSDHPGDKIALDAMFFYYEIPGTLSLPSTLTVKQGLPQALMLTFSPADCFMHSIRWTSGNTDILQVDQNGYVTGLKPGYATVTVTGVTAGRITVFAPCYVQVEPHLKQQYPDAIRSILGNDYHGGLDYFLFSVEPDLAQRLHDGQKVAYDLRPGTNQGKNTLDVWENTFQPADIAQDDPNSLGHLGQPWLALKRNNPLWTGAAFHTDATQPLDISKIQTKIDDYYLHLAARVPDGKKGDVTKFAFSWKTADGKDTTFKIAISPNIYPKEGEVLEYEGYRILRTYPADGQWHEMSIPLKQAGMIRPFAGASSSVGGDAGGYNFLTFSTGSTLPFVNDRQKQYVNTDAEVHLDALYLYRMPLPDSICVKGKALTLPAGTKQPGVQCYPLGSPHYPMRLKVSDGSKSHIRVDNLGRIYAVAPTSQPVQIEYSAWWTLPAPSLSDGTLHSLSSSDYSRQTTTGTAAISVTQPASTLIPANGRGFFPLLLNADFTREAAAHGLFSDKYIVGDLRPNDQTRFLDLWQGSLSPDTTAAGDTLPGFYGTHSLGILLKKDAESWAGIGLRLNLDQDDQKDLRRIPYARDKYYFHISLRSKEDDEPSLVTLQFTDGVDTVFIPLGRDPNTGMPTKYDFPRDGEWYNLVIPLADNLFDVTLPGGSRSTLFSKTLPDDGQLNIFSLTVEGLTASELAIDAAFFFYDGVPPSQSLDNEILSSGSFRVGEIAKIKVRLVPDFLGEPLPEDLAWESNQQWLNVENGYLSAQQSGTALVTVRYLSSPVVSSTIEVTVLPSLIPIQPADKGFNYALLLLDAQTASSLGPDRLVDDLRPDDTQRILQIWDDQSLTPRDPDTEEQNSFGKKIPWLSLLMPDTRNWGGGAIVNTLLETHRFPFGFEPYRSISCFHIALKSSKPLSSYTFRLHDGIVQTQPFVIGNCPNPDGIEPLRNFPHDGKWHSVRIPLNHELFDDLFRNQQNTIQANSGTPYFTFTTFAELGQGQTIDFDAALFYTVGGAAPSHISLNHEALTLEVGHTSLLEVIEILPLEAYCPPAAMIWQTSDPTVAVVQSGIVSALREGDVSISVYLPGYPQLKVSCSLSVKPSSFIRAPGANSLDGTHYRIFLAGNKTMEALHSSTFYRLDDFWAPDVIGTAGRSSLNVWEATLEAAVIPPGDKNSYNMDDAFLSLALTGKGWGAAAFATGKDVPIDLTEMIAHKEDYVFHVALKSSEPVVAYRFSLSDGLHSCHFAVGNTWYDDLFPIRDFPHNGAWHEIEIPLSELLAIPGARDLFKEVINRDDGVDLLAFSRLGESGSKIDMDAVFFYCPAKTPTSVSFAFTDTSLLPNEVIRVLPAFKPYAGYLPDSKWLWTVTPQSPPGTLPIVAMYNGGILSAFKTGDADVKFSLQGTSIQTGFRVSVQQPAPRYSLSGTDYHLVFLDRYNFSVIQDRTRNDLRTGVPGIAGTPEIQIWRDHNNNLTLKDGIDKPPNSYGSGGTAETNFLNFRIAEGSDWGGGAFHLPQAASSIDMTPLAANPQDYVFHFAMRSKTQDAAYRIILSNGREERSFVVGNRFWVDNASPLDTGLVPLRNFPADGNWYEFEIPLAHPLFEGFFNEPLTVPQGGLNIVSFVTTRVTSGSTAVTDLCIDAVFFYRPYQPITSITLPPGGISVRQGEVVHVDALSNDVHGLLRWKTLHPHIAAASNQGFVSGFKQGSTQLVVSYGDEPLENISPPPPPNDNDDDDGYVLVWNDEFDDPDGSLPHAQRWTYDVGNGENGWGNAELQYYLANPDNAQIRDGHLVITARQEEYFSYPYTSARLRSRQAWKYGKVEVAFKLPSGYGTWPAVWMLPANNVYGAWPASGEIDIMEHIGKNPAALMGTVHMAAAASEAGPTMTHNIYPSAEAQPHKITLLWDEQSISWYVDDAPQPFFTFSKTDAANYTQWPFDQEFYLILNLAVGGYLGGTPDPNIWPQQFLLDYIRVYQKNSTPSLPFISDTCNLTVFPQEPIPSLEGLDYTVLSLGQAAIDTLPLPVIKRDLRPDLALQLWESSFFENQPAPNDTDSYGKNDGGAINLQVGSRGWSGGAFFLPSGKADLDLTALTSPARREFFFFHLALRSQDPSSSFTFTFNDGTKSASIVIGNKLGEGGIPPSYDFPRDGQWHQINIPLSLPLFDNMFKNPIHLEQGANGLNLLSFLAGGEPWTTLSMDALFFYDLTQQQLSLALDQQQIDLSVQSVAKLTATTTPAIKVHQVLWKSLNPEIASVVNGGFITALSPGQATIVASLQGIERLCTVNVSANESVNSLHGSHYNALFIDETTFAWLGERLERDLRPGTPVCDLDNWKGQMDFLPSDEQGANSYGLEEAWLRMRTKQGETWSGGAFRIKPLANGLDMRHIAQARDQYSLHLALRSTRSASSYTFQLPNGHGDTVRFAIGNQFGEGGILPLYNFARDGQWHQINIPLSLPLFDGFFDKVIAASNSVDFFGFILSGSGNELGMDAVFFYKRPIPVEGIRVRQDTTWVYTGEPFKLQTAFLPEDAFTEQPLSWRSLNTALLTVDDQGWLLPKVASNAYAAVEVSLANFKDTAYIRIHDPPQLTPTSLTGSHYYILSLGDQPFDALKDRLVIKDWRPAKNEGCQLNIQGTSFRYADPLGTDCYGYLNTNWVALTVADKNWSGAAFQVSDPQGIDLTPIFQEDVRSKYSFHLALKADHEFAYTFTFSNGVASAQLVIGLAGSLNFPRDGQWHEIDIPLTHPVFNGLYNSPFGPEGQPIQLLDFSAGSTQGTTLDLDAVFFYQLMQPPQAIAVNPTSIRVEEQTVATLSPTLLPQGAYANISWKSRDASIATVYDGIVSAISAGNTVIEVRTDNNVLAEVPVQVLPKRLTSGLLGSQYYVLSMDQTTLTGLSERGALKADLRPGTASGYDLDVWEQTFNALSQTGSTNSYGQLFPWIRLEVANKKWSGAAFTVANTLDLSALAAARANSNFHVALKTKQTRSAYTFTFTDGSDDTARIVIGNMPNENGLIPKYDFIRNGLWQEIDIPLNIPQFNGLYEQPFGTNGQKLNILAFSAGKDQGTVLEMDALFFYKEQAAPEDFEVTPLQLEMKTSEVRKLSVKMLPLGSFATVVWRSRNEEVATVRNGFVSAIAPGVAVLEAQIGTLVRTVAVSVLPKEETYPLFGTHYYLLSLDNTTATNLKDLGNVIRDFRPGVSNNKLEIWDQTFSSFYTSGANSFNQFEKWIGLGVNDKGWSGAAFVVQGDVDLQELRQDRDNWFFHIALKSTQPASAFTFTFNDTGEDEDNKAVIVIGNTEGTAGRQPKYDFPRNDKWHHFDIPLALPEFDLLYRTPLQGPNKLLNLLEFSAGSQQWTTLEIDGLFFYKRIPPSQLVPEALTLTQQEVKKLSVLLLPDGAYAPLKWESLDQSICTVREGWVSALRPGTAQIRVSAGSISALVEVTVLPAPQVDALKGLNYYPLLLGASTFNELNNRQAIVRDFRPDALPPNRLMIWENTFAPLLFSDTNSFGRDEPWIRLAVTNIGWSGAAFSVAAPVDWRQIVEHRNDYFFHLALKSTQHTSYTLTFSDGSHSVPIVIGDEVNADGVKPLFNFIRNGQWQHLHIPLSLPQFDGLYEFIFGSEAFPANLLAFSAGGVTGSEIHLDAVFLYKREVLAESIHLQTHEQSLRAGETAFLPVVILPATAERTPVWRSLNPQVAAVKQGVVWAIAPGKADIEVSVDGLSDTCHITVLPPPVINSLLGNNYYLLFIGASALNALYDNDRTVIADFRPGVNLLNKLNIWEETFIPADATGHNSYGHNDPWIGWSVANKGWSGGAFAVQGNVDLRALHNAHKDYYFHVALKSQTNELYTFTFADNEDTVHMLIGDHPDADGTLPAFNFPRDGQWHEINIPLNNPAFEHLFDTELFKTTNNLVSFSAGSTWGTSLHMDAVFFYQNPTSLSELRLDKTSLSLQQQDVALLSPSYAPAQAFVSWQWKSLNTDVATVRNGIVSAVGVGTAQIVVYCKALDDTQWLTDTCLVSVSTAFTPNNLLGTNYYVMLLNADIFNSLAQQERMHVTDFRPGSPIGNNLHIWENTFTAQTRNGINSYGRSGDWIRFTVTDKGWSGGAFVTDATIDLRELNNARQRSYLHLALKSDQPQTLYTFTFTDDKDTVSILIGDTIQDGIFPTCNFKRNGLWQHIDIPLSLPVFNPLFDASYGGNASSLLSFSAGGQQGAVLEMDAAFYYKAALTPTAYLLPDVTLTQQQVTFLNGTFVPQGAFDTIQWRSRNPGIATVNEGFVSALNVGKTTIEVLYKGQLIGSCLITVLPHTKHNILYGSHYHLLLAGEYFTNALLHTARSIDHDWRPGINSANNLMVWQQTFSAGNAGGWNSFGVDEPWLQLVVADKGWSGAAFTVAQEVDLSTIRNQRDKYFFHAALKSDNPQQVYTFIFSDGKDTARIVIGDRPGDNLILPLYNFTRDGNWHTLHIPLSLPQFDKLYDQPFGSTQDVANIFAFSAGSIQGSTLDMDAVFFYRAQEAPTSITLPSLVTLQEADVMHLPVSFLPPEAYHPLSWTAPNPSIATANQELISAFRQGETVLTASANGVLASCTVKVLPKPYSHSLHGSHYYLLSLGQTAFSSLLNNDRIIMADWRPGSQPANQLQVWDATFNASTQQGDNSYGNDEPWIGLQVTGKQWSGAAFTVSGQLDLQPLYKARNDYAFHFALKSTQPIAAYTFTFSDANNNAVIVIGNCPGEKNTLPLYDFPRDGLWHHFDLPLSLPQFDNLFQAPFGSASTQLPLLAFSAGGDQGTTLDLDAAFFYKPQPPLQKLRLSTKQLTLQEQDAFLLKVETEPEATFVELQWKSLDSASVAVNDGILSALKASAQTIPIIVYGGGFNDTCYVKVNPHGGEQSLYGSDYHVLSLGDNSFKSIQSKVVNDWRPDAALQVWDATFNPADLAGVRNSYGLADPWIALAVADKGWSGAAFALSQTIDLTSLRHEREKYRFHLALKSTQPRSVYTFSFTDGTQDTVHIAIGNKKNQNGLPPAYDFARDGLWHEINIPLSLPLFDNLYKQPFGNPQKPLNLLAFSAGDQQGTPLHLDALFFYKIENKVTAITLPPAASINEQDVVPLELVFLPQGVHAELLWTSSNASVATVNDGRVTGVGPGQATITAKCGDLQASCLLTVQPLPPSKSLQGNHYYLFSLDPASYQSLLNDNRSIERDWRPGLGKCDLQIWEETFQPLTPTGNNSFGLNQAWIALAVANKEWSGAAFKVNGNIDLRPLAATRSNYFFHIALRSTRQTIYTLTFSDGAHNASVVIGDLPNAEGVTPSFNFVRNGQWHEIDIPLSHPTFDGLFSSQFNGDNINLLAFSAGHNQADVLDMDAVFFYAREEGVASVVLSDQTLSLQPQQLHQLTTNVPAGASGRLVWRSLDNQIASVSNGFVSALRAGTTRIIAQVNNLADTCLVTVAPPSTATGIAGSGFVLFSLAESLAGTLSDALIYDFRPKAVSLPANLMIWESTFSAQTVSGLNSYGIQEPWVALKVADKGWSGGAFHVGPAFGSIDLQQLRTHRNDYYFHLALRSSHPDAVFSFTFSDGTHQAVIPIGPDVNDDGVAPQYNFIRDGQWKEFNIPLSLPQFDDLFKQPFGGAANPQGISLLAFSAGGQQGTLLEMDALFLYRRMDMIGMYFTASTLNLPQQTVRKLDLKILPQGVAAWTSWHSSNPDVATVNHGIVSAFGVGTTTITASYRSFSTSCLVNVTPAESVNSLLGSDYLLLQIGQTAFSQIKDRLLYDFRPNGINNDLQVWSSTFAGQPATTPDSYGYSDSWLRMLVLDQGWSGAAYVSSLNGNPLDLRALYNERHRFFFHLALKSTKPVSAFTFTFSDGSDIAKIVIGNCLDGDNIAPRYDFLRNGLWQEINIPLSLPEFDALYDSPISASSLNLLAFSAGAQQGTMIDLDALFFYKKPIILTDLLLSQQTLSLTVQSVQHLSIQPLPEGAAIAPLWQSSNPTVATVNDGFVTAISPGVALISVSSNGITKSCTVTVSPAPARNPLHGSNYTVLLMGENAFDAISSALNLVDLRPGNQDRELYLWDQSFAAAPGTDDNSFGQPGQWLQMTVSNKGWSGASFNVPAQQPLPHWATIAPLRQEYSFHIALKTALPASAYTFTFTDLADTVRLVIGNREDDNGLFPLFDFPRDDRWHHIDVPLSLPLFDPLFDSRSGFPANGRTDVLAVSAGGTEGTLLNMDAVFFYRHPVYTTALSLQPTAELSVGQAFTLNPILSPAHAYAGDISWSSEQEDIASVDRKGLVKALKQGTTTIWARSPQFAAACLLTVYRPSVIRLDKKDLILAPDMEEALTVDLSDFKGAGPNLWRSANPDVASVSSSGKVKALRQGSTWIEVARAGVTDTCFVFVIATPPPPETFSSLQGDEYYVISLASVPFDAIRDKVVKDFRPNNSSSQLQIWENTLEAGHATGLNSYGSRENWASLAVPEVSPGWSGDENSIGWSGAAYHLAEAFGHINMTPLALSPEHFVFHIALRSRSSSLFYLLTFSDSQHQASLLIANQPVDGRPPDFDFPRDGLWHEIEVPLPHLHQLLLSSQQSSPLTSLTSPPLTSPLTPQQSPSPQSASPQSSSSALRAVDPPTGSLYDQPFTGPINLLSFVSSGLPHTAIDLDAIFFYRKPATSLLPSDPSDPASPFDPSAPRAVDPSTGASPFFLYPLPARDILYIGGLKEPTLVHLFDMTGRLRLLQKTSPSSPLNLAPLPPGIYLLSAQ
ncbi:MAG: Ig-like domain-containing protein, partial [Tannerellaceae bacterium]|nr:Ig-like domain-containing protein [Tannerellaceae bacterium]